MRSALILISLLLHIATNSFYGPVVQLTMPKRKGLDRQNRTVEPFTTNYQLRKIISQTFQIPRTSFIALNKDGYDIDLENHDIVTGLSYDQPLELTILLKS